MTKKLLSPSEVSVLVLFKKERLTRAIAAERHPSMMANSVRCYITKLLKASYLQRDSDQSMSKDGKTVYLSITASGLEALKVGPMRKEREQKVRVRDVKPYDVNESLQRSPLYSRPTYEPEKFEPARKGALDFLKIKSLGF